LPKYTTTHKLQSYLNLRNRLHTVRLSNQYNPKAIGDCCF